MSIASNQVKMLSDIVLLDLMRNGKIIPSRFQIMRALASVVNSSGTILGNPSFLGYVQGGKSDPETYNENIARYLFDVSVVTGEHIEQVQRLLRGYFANELHLDKYRRILDNLISKIEAAIGASGYDINVLSDTFENLNGVDLLRSTAIVDTASGKVLLDTGIPAPLDLSFLRERTEPSYMHFSSPILAKNLAPQTSFGNIVSGNNSYWLVRVRTENPGELSSTFEIPLTPEGGEVSFNTIQIEHLNPAPARILIEYKSGLNWLLLLNRIIVDKELFVFDDVEGSSLRLTITRANYDQILGSNYLYLFGLKHIAILSSATKRFGEAVTKSLRINPQSSEYVTSAILTLGVDENKPAGTSISYFVAADPYISGTYYSDGYFSKDPYDWGTDGLYWSPDASGSYTRTSYLRDFPVGEAASYATWEPEWMEITPGQELFLDFADTLGPEEALNGFPDYASPFSTWSNVDLFKVYEFRDNLDSTRSPIPSNINLQLGKNCFLFKEEVFEYVDDIIAQGTIVDGRMDIVGDVTASIIQGSIREVRPWGTPEARNNTGFFEKEDYLIIYGVPNRYSAQLVSNGGRITVLGDDFLPVQYKYSVRRTETFYYLETSFFYDVNQLKESAFDNPQEPIIKVYWWDDPSFGRISEVSLTNYSGSGRILGKRVELEKPDNDLVKIDIRQVGAGMGWFTLRIRLAFDLSDDIICILTDAGVGVETTERVLIDKLSTRTSTATTATTTRTLVDKLSATTAISQAPSGTTLVTKGGTTSRTTTTLTPKGGSSTVTLRPKTPTSPGARTLTPKTPSRPGTSPTPFQSAATTPSGSDTVSPPVTSSTIEVSLVDAFFILFQMRKRVFLPSFITNFAWKDSASRVSEDYMKYRVHRFDHTKYAIIKGVDGIFSLVSNNLGQFGGRNRLVYGGEALNPLNGILEQDLANFYDISFSLSVGRFDSLFLKAVLSTENNASPELRGYTIAIKS